MALPLHFFRRVKTFSILPSNSLPKYAFNFGHKQACKTFMLAEPLTKHQHQTYQLLYPILLQEINTKKPSSLLHYLVGKGVLFWQDVVIIRSKRQTDLEQNR